MIRIELMMPEPPRRADFTWALAGLAVTAVAATGLAAYRVLEYLAYLDSLAV